MTKKAKENSVDLKFSGEVKETKIDLRSKFRSLDPSMQVIASNFFQCHNMAIWFYNSADQITRDYLDICIRLSQEGKFFEQEDV